VFWFVAILLTIEITFCVFVPLVVPDHAYLWLYLGDHRRSRAEELYTGNSEMFIYDQACGWRNRPGYRHDKWVIDEYGGRSTGPVSIERNSKSRILFLGNSLTNGGTHVLAGETISAAVEDSVTETLNFATMLYSVDQSYRAYRQHLKQYRPDVVVVGLSGWPTKALVNRYIPFRSKTQQNMPFFKPRFTLVDGQLELLDTPSPDACMSVYRSSEIIRSLKHTDDYYSYFVQDSRFGYTPIASAIKVFMQKARGFLRNLDQERPHMDLYREIIERMVVEVEKDGAKVVFMILPSKRLVKPGWRGRLPDQYGHLVAEMRSWGLTVLDGRRILLEAGIPINRLYYADGGHYSPEGNRVLADALKPLLATDTAP
jgi:hypothetical protein